VRDDDVHERLDAIEQELRELRGDLLDMLEMNAARNDADRQLGRAVENLMRAHKPLLHRVGHAAERVAARRNTR
jgi:hypothetical protein